MPLQGAPWLAFPRTKSILSVRKTASLLRVRHESHPRLGSERQNRHLFLPRRTALLLREHEEKKLWTFPFRRTSPIFSPRSTISSIAKSSRFRHRTITSAF